MRNTFCASCFFVIVFLALSLDASSLANCAVKAYSQSCEKCTFDKDGKMDRVCYDSYQKRGEACLVARYPIMAAQYGLGMCPAVDACISKLKACSSLMCLGSDLQDCVTPVCYNCYHEADRCVERASKDCDAEANCGDKKCEKDKGETQETCCTDCGCGGSLTCKVNACSEEKDSAGGECLRSGDDLYYGCNTPPYTESECKSLGVAHYDGKGYKEVKAKCCKQADWGFDCYFTAKRTKADELINEAENGLMNICLGAAALPLLAASGVILLELPTFLRRGRI